MALDRAVDDLDRLFRHLVFTLAEQRPAQLTTPFQVSELYQEIIPYRACRAALRFDTNEDYEMAVLRLLAGGRGYALLEPPEARDALAVEADALSPFPGAFRDYAAARVSLSAAAVRAVLEGRASYAPAAAPQQQAIPDLEAPRMPLPSDRGSPSAGLPYLLDSSGDGPPDCPHCGRTLPGHRAVVFCPFCGAAVSAARCPKCDTELERGWMFCITCRHPVSPTSPAHPS